MKIKFDLEKQLETRINTEVAEFFGVKPRDIRIIVCESKNDLDKSWHEAGGYEEEAPDWLVAFASYGNDIHILSSDIIPAGYEKSSKLRYQKVLKHELTHLYVNDVNKKLPSWLKEGCSLYVAGQNHYKPIDLKDLSIHNLHELDSAPTDKRIYSVGINVVSEIVKKHGKEKLFEIISIKGSKARYAELQKMFNWS
jgi:hypothetical protein